MYIPPNVQRIIRVANGIIGIVYAVPVVPIYDRLARILSTGTVNCREQI